MDISEIQELIKFVAKAGVNEVEIEKKDFKLLIKSDYLAKKKSNFKEETKIVQQPVPVASIPAAAPAPVQEAVQAPAPAVEPDKAASNEEDNGKSSNDRNFYRAKSRQTIIC